MRNSRQHDGHRRPVAELRADRDLAVHRLDVLAADAEARDRSRPARRAPSPRQKRSNTRGSSSAGMPCSVVGDRHGATVLVLACGEPDGTVRPGVCLSALPTRPTMHLVEDVGIGERDRVTLDLDREAARPRRAAASGRRRARGARASWTGCSTGRSVAEPMRASVSKRSVSRCRRSASRCRSARKVSRAGNVVLRACLEHLDGGHDRGERRAQLVRGVGEEAPFGCLAIAFGRAIGDDDEASGRWRHRRAAQRAGREGSGRAASRRRARTTPLPLPSALSRAAAGQGCASGRPRSTAIPRSSPAAGLTISTMPVGSRAITPSSSRLRTADSAPRSCSTTAKATARRSRISSMLPARLPISSGNPSRTGRSKSPPAIVPAAVASRRTRRVTRLATARLTMTASATAIRAPSASLRRKASLVRAASPVRGA